MSRSPIIIKEGKETDDFWSALGGKKPYKKSRPAGENPLLPPRMFHCSDARGKFRVEEIDNFSQEVVHVS